MSTEASEQYFMTQEKRLAKYELLKTCVKTIDKDYPPHFAILSTDNDLTEIKITYPAQLIEKK